MLPLGQWEGKSQWPRHQKAQCRPRSHACRGALPPGPAGPQTPPRWGSPCPLPAKPDGMCDHRSPPVTKAGRKRSRPVAPPGAPHWLCLDGTFVQTRPWRPGGAGAGGCSLLGTRLVLLCSRKDEGRLLIRTRPASRLGEMGSGQDLGQGAQARACEGGQGAHPAHSVGGQGAAGSSQVTVPLGGSLEGHPRGPYRPNLHPKRTHWSSGQSRWAVRTFR